MDLKKYRTADELRQLIREAHQASKELFGFDTAKYKAMCVYEDALREELAKVLQEISSRPH